MMIKRTGVEISLTLNNKLYPDSAVRECAERFSGLCRISVSREGKYNRVSFSGLDAGDMEEVVMEFANHVLYLTKSGAV